MDQPSLIRVFCYGSNMSSKRMTTPKRCPSATFCCIAKIVGYKLIFNKISTDNSSKANLASTQNTSDIVWGVIFNVPHSEKLSLDIAEGKGSGYEEFTISVNDLEENVINCQCYIATKVGFLNDSLAPYDWYKEHCIIGAEEHNLPLSYIDSIKLIPGVIDPCLERSEKERSIYKI